jgi:hypothetical protein
MSLKSGGREPMWQSLPGPWIRVHKGDVRARELADRHYTRQHPGHPMWTRPGYNYVLLAEYQYGRAVFCWWRPKWEDGRLGTKRRDGLRVVECTIFRREGITPRSSDLIRSAVDSLSTEDAMKDLHLDAAGSISHLITGVNSAATKRGRSRLSAPGTCFRNAGWTEFTKRSGKADTWLSLPWENSASLASGLATRRWNEKTDPEAK